jgi:hypothetical protein
MLSSTYRIRGSSALSTLSAVLFTQGKLSSQLVVDVLVELNQHYNQAKEELADAETRLEVLRRLETIGVAPDQKRKLYDEISQREWDSRRAGYRLFWIERVSDVLRQLDAA